MSFETFGRGCFYESIIDTIGNTPLVKLRNLGKRHNAKAEILAKLEFFNPLSSVKDRTALGMIEDAESKGLLHKNSIIVEPTSGNTGIGLAFIAAVRGYRLVLTMPENMSLERRRLLEFLGAGIILTPAAEGIAGAVRKAEDMVRSDPNAIMLQQFKNPANPAIHKTTTASEIWNDTKGKVDVFVAGVGTGGTLQGVAEELKSRKPDIRIVAVEPASSPVLSGGKAGPHKIQGIGANFVPDILDVKIIDEIVAISDDEAMHTARELARKEGILSGISSGAAIAASIKIAVRPEMEGKTIVAILPDSGDRYVSTELFE